MKGEVFKVSVNGTHFPVQETYLSDGKVDKGYYSHKFKSSGLSYEVAVVIFSDQIVWVNAPFQAGMTDLHIFKYYGLATLLVNAIEKAVELAML
mgnify:FL=1